MKVRGLDIRPADVAVAYAKSWDDFWFTPRLPHTLGMLRIITGVMLLYSHLVLATDLGSFLGPNAWVSNELSRKLHDGAFGFSDLGFSYLWYIDSSALLWMHHLLVIAVTACFAAGFLTRVMAPLAWFFQLMYLHRLTGALFGFDQIVTYSTMYLMLAPCGSCFSVDAWLREKWAERRSKDRRLQWMLPSPTPSVAANVCTRLFQIHLCVIYLFGGLAKARGEMWWDGTAMWYSVSNYEYQSMDMTWIASYPTLFSALTHATLLWEIFYCALIWPRRTRPIALAIAVGVHGGIAAFLGMITFGVMMIGANMIFLPPELVRKMTKGGEEADSDQEEPASQDDSAAPGTSLNEEADDDDEFEDEFALEDLGLDDEFEFDSNASGVLGASLDGDASGSGVLDHLKQRDEALKRREQRLRDASRTLREKKDRLNENLEKYNRRVSKLKKREAKIRKLVDRKRKRSAGEE